MEVCMSNKSLEELYKEQLEKYNNLDAISYEEAVDLLIDNNNHSQIGYHSWRDCINKKNYYLVTVLDCDTCKIKKFLAQDQNPVDIYNNLMIEIEKKQINPRFRLINDAVTEIMCCFGNNKIIFPTDIVQYVYDLSSDKSEDGFKCIYGGTEMFIPKSLPKKKKKAKKYTM